MKKFLMAIVVGMGLFTTAEVPDPAVRELSKAEVMALPKEARRAYMQKLVALKTGGRISKPNTGRGAVRIICSTKSIGKDAMDESLAALTKVIKIDVRMIEGAKPEILSAKDDLKKYSAQAGVFVVEDSSLPRLLVAPEEGWAIVNVTALKDRASSPEVVTARIRKEMTRALMFVCGCGNAGAVMQPVANTSDLDAISVETFPPVVRNQLLGHLKKLGVEPVYEASYMRACQEGWAPSPTNDVQKAIWDKVHAPPKTPLKIEFDPKKGK